MLNCSLAPLNKFYTFYCGTGLIRYTGQSNYYDDPFNVHRGIEVPSRILQKQYPFRLKLMPPFDSCSF